MLSRQLLPPRLLGRLLHTTATGQQFQNLKKLSESDAQRLRVRVAGVVGEKNVSLAEAVRSQHGQDEGPDKGRNPDLVAYPQSTEHVSEVRVVTTAL